MNEGKLKLSYVMCDDTESLPDNETDEQMENQNIIPQPKTNRRSYVWRYFSTVPDHADVYRCKICNETFGNKTSNLGRHLQAAHNISDQAEESVKRGRPNRSIVWNFCTKLDDKRALCHICKKILYFGGGNTSNITKHLRRMHAEKVDEVVRQMPKSIQWGAESPSSRKERRASSYVWQYCEKVSKNTVLCKLCDSRMRFHGTANVITHLQRRHGIMDETTTIKTDAEKNVQEVATSSTNDTATAVPYRPSISMVWKYIIRISDDTVRCRVCLKNLSYQGTSNLQRHLHRMHNIMWNGKESSFGLKVETDPTNDNNSFFDFCETTNDPTVWKCQMCEEHFEHTDSLEEIISSHMIKVHSAAIRGESPNDFRSTEEESEIEQLYSTVVEDNNIISESTTTEQHMDISNTITDEAIYNDIIVVEEDLNGFEETSDNLIFESSMSTQSGDNIYSDYSAESNDAQLVTTTIEADDTPLMRELKEDLLRQQASYFSEKAGFYRMQKFLVAQQVRKERLEIEKLKADRSLNESSNLS